MGLSDWLVSSFGGDAFLWVIYWQVLELLSLMLFKRRNNSSLLEKVRVFLWPRRSWSRSVNYVMLRVNRLSGSAHTIALGCAAGIFVSFSPFMGLHFLIAALIAYVIGGNLLASALGTFFGNPITFPFIWASAYKFGHWILGNEITAFRVGDLLDTFSKGLLFVINNAYEVYILPMMLGGAPLGFITAFFGYFIIRNLVEKYQKARADRLAKRAGEITVS